MATANAFFENVELEVLLCGAVFPGAKIGDVTLQGTEYYGWTVTDLAQIPSK